MFKRYSLAIAINKARYSGYLKAILHACFAGSNSVASYPYGHDLLTTPVTIMITCFLLRTKGTGLDEVKGNAKS